MRERLATPTSEAAGSPTATYMEEVIKTFASPGGFNVGSVGPEGSPIHEENNIWRTYSIFDSETGERRSADKLLNFELENLVLSADTEVLEILFDGDDGVPRLPFLSQGDVPRARCIRTAARGFLRPQKITCVRDGGRIYVAAGTIHSAALLLQSGVGPGKRIESPEVRLRKYRLSAAAHELSWLTCWCSDCVNTLTLTRYLLLHYLCVRVCILTIGWREFQ